MGGGTKAKAHGRQQEIPCLPSKWFPFDTPKAKEVLTSEVDRVGAHRKIYATCPCAEQPHTYSGCASIYCTVIGGPPWSLTTQTIAPGGCGPSFRLLHRNPSQATLCCAIICLSSSSFLIGGSQRRQTNTSTVQSSTIFVRSELNSCRHQCLPQNRHNLSTSEKQ